MDKDLVVKVFTMLVDKIEEIHHRMDGLEQTIKTMDEKVNRLGMTCKEQFFGTGFLPMEFTYTKVRKEFEGNDSSNATWMFEIDTECFMNDLFEVGMMETLGGVIDNVLIRKIIDYMEENGAYDEIPLQEVGITDSEFDTLDEFVMDAIVRSVVSNLKKVNERYPSFFELEFSEESGDLYDAIHSIGSLLEKFHLCIQSMSVYRK